jgi:hypothetical protein
VLPIFLVRHLYVAVEQEYGAWIHGRSVEPVCRVTRLVLAHRLMYYERHRGRHFPPGSEIVFCYLL